MSNTEIISREFYQRGRPRSIYVMVILVECILHFRLYCPCDSRLGNGWTKNDNGENVKFNVNILGISLQNRPIMLSPIQICHGRSALKRENE